MILKKLWRQLIQIKHIRLSNYRLELSIIAVLLFCFNYWICELFFPDNLVTWWELRTNIYAIIIAMAFYIARFETKGFMKFVLSVGVGLCFSDVIDRTFFDIKHFTIADVLMILGTIIISIYDATRNR